MKAAGVQEKQKVCLVSDFSCSYSLRPIIGQLPVLLFLAPSFSGLPLPLSGLGLAQVTGPVTESGSGSRLRQAAGEKLRVDGAVSL